jgi:VWFA-related protein
MVRPFAWIAVVGAVVAAGAMAVRAQAPAQPGAGFAASTTAVMVDVLVRDRKGALVTDLTSADFELHEDGVRQTIGAVTLAAAASNTAPVTSAPAVAGARPATAPSSDATPSILALVFDNLSAEGRVAARRAALACVDGMRATTDRVGVFASDAPLRTIQAYTADREAVRRAVDAAATSVLTKGSRARPGRGALDAAISPTAGAESGGRPDRDRPVSRREIDAAATPSVGADGRMQNQPGVVVDLLVERATQRMDEAYTEFQRDADGQSGTTSLLAIVTSLAPLPGRKTVLLFAENFAVPESASVRFQAIIDTANRANVSIYAIDAGGLRAHSGQSETQREVAALGRRGVGDSERTSSEPYTRDLERNEDVLRQDPSASLGLLARQTGGFLIDATNDLRAGVRRIEAERRFHYLLTYSPVNARFHGEFRRITVTVRRPQVQVRARQGYVATPGPAASPALRYEAAALAVLAAGERRADMAVRGRGLLFPRRDGLSEVAVVVALKAGDMGHWADPATQRYRTDFTILARLRDVRGDVVWKGSETYRLHGALSEVERARAGDVVFFRQAALPHGIYTLDYVVHDAMTGNAGTGSEPVIVDDANGREMHVGSLVLVRTAERLGPDERATRNPLHVGALALTPNVGEPLNKTLAAQTSFYVRIQPAGRQVSGTIELRHSGVSLGSVALATPQPDADGGLTYLGTLPLTEVAPGACELRLRVSDGAATVTRSVSFILDR